MVFLSKSSADDGGLCYVRDDATEMIIHPQEENTRRVELRIYGAVEAGRIVYGGGDLHNESATEWKEETEQERPDGTHTARVLTLTGKIGAPTLKFSSKGVIHQTTFAPVDASGEYKLVTNKELTKRMEQRYIAADALLNQRYKAIMASLSETKGKELKTLQKGWIGHRDYMAGATERHGDEPAPHTLDYWDEMHEQTVTRVQFLNAFAGIGVKPGLTGEFRDFSGGTLTLSQKQNGLAFTFEVVRGPTFHLGNVEGVAKFNEDKSKATWVDSSNADCKIFFTFEEGRMTTVTEQNTSEYHGARAYFSGTYYKVVAATK